MSIEFDFGSNGPDGKDGDWLYELVFSSPTWISGLGRPNVASAVRAVARLIYNQAERNWRRFVRYVPTPRHSEIWVLVPARKFLEAVAVY